MILGLKTTGTDQAQLVLATKDGEQVDEISWQPGYELNQQILPQIETLLNRNETSAPKLTGVVCFEGPGSFTALRIGATVANTLAYSQQIPVVAVSGGSWLEAGIEQLEKIDRIKFITPNYGKEPNITKPKK